MNLSKLFDLQRKLDQKIIQKHGLQDMDRLPYLVLALQVELGECSNEWRGFKFWSKDREPRTKRMIECPVCEGTGDWNYEFVQEDAESGTKHVYEDCHECGGSGFGRYENPLLEEYVDCLHFVLSIGLEMKIAYEDVSLNYYKELFKDVTDVNHQFLLTYRLITDVWIDGDVYDYLSLVGCVFALGELLGFTLEQIEQAYMAKNKVNWERQEDGY